MGPILAASAVVNVILYVMLKNTLTTIKQERRAYSRLIRKYNELKIKD
jgi:hypothetical protein